MALTKRSRPDSFARWLLPRREMSTDQLRSELERVDIDTLDRWVFGVIGDEIIQLAPSKLTIVHRDDLENALHQAGRYPGGAKQWAKSVSLATPVDVSVRSPGVFTLEDGHHRYLAAKLSGRKLTAKIQIKGKPIEVLLERAGKTHKTAAQLEREIADALAK
jgi:hypothetical protein